MRFEDFRKKVEVKFSIDDNKYIIAKVREIPNFSDKIFSIIKDKNEITVITQEGIELQSVSEEKFFRLITFDVKLPFDLTGFLSYVSNLLASENIPIFVISAYSTDHIFVKEGDLDKTIEILKKNGMVLS